MTPRRKNVHTILPESDDFGTVTNLNTLLLIVCELLVRQNSIERNQERAV